MKPGFIKKKIVRGEKKKKVKEVHSCMQALDSTGRSALHSLFLWHSGGTAILGRVPYAPQSQHGRPVAVFSQGKKKKKKKKKQEKRRPLTFALSTSLEYQCHIKTQWRWFLSSEGCTNSPLRDGGSRENDTMDLYRFADHTMSRHPPSLPPSLPSAFAPSLPPSFLVSSQHF